MLEQALKNLNEERNLKIELLKVIEKRIHNVKVRIFERDHGVKIGSVVRDSYGVEFKVSGIEPFFDGGIQLRGHKRKINRQWSKPVRYIYEWELVESEL